VDDTIEDSVHKQRYQPSDSNKSVNILFERSILSLPLGNTEIN